MECSGLSSTAAIYVETAKDLGFDAVIIEPNKTGGEATSLETILAEPIPVLTGSGTRAGPDEEEGSWTGRTATVQRVLARWFQVKDVSWKR